jgi:predicted DNA-binding transcriptional regulator AlpA
LGQATGADSRLAALIKRLNGRPGHRGGRAARQGFELAILMPECREEIGGPAGSPKGFDWSECETMPNKIVSKEPPNVTGTSLAAAPEAGDAFEIRARRMLNEKQVRAIVPVGHTTLWRLEKAGRFPKSTYISPNRRIWFEDEIAAWQNEIDGNPRTR